MAMKIQYKISRLVSNIFCRRNILPVGCIAAMVINHIYMHRTVLDGFGIGVVWTYRSLVFTMFDILGVMLLMGALTLMRSRRIAYTLTWGVMTVLQLSNIIYSRFFGQYLSLSSLGEMTNLSGGWWTNYVAEAFRWSDIIIVATSLCMLLMIWNDGIARRLTASDNNIMRGRMNWKALIAGIMLTVLPHTMLSDAYDAYQKDFPKSIGEYFSRTQGDIFCTRVNTEQKLYCCAYGLLRTEVYMGLFCGSNTIELTDADMQAIERYAKAKNQSRRPVAEGDTLNVTGRDVSFIIVESYLAFVSDLKVNGQEVTPNLNRLRHTEGTYYNGKMKSCISVGESSDAQFTLFTGLLPLDNEITVATIAHKKFAAFPGLLAAKGYTTHISVPTKPFVWHQEEVNRVYGIDSMSSTIKDNSRFISEDDELMNMAIDVEKSIKHPFLHIILTASMHSPYSAAKEFPEDVPLKFPAGYSPELCNYLRACWFADRQIGRYIDNLKATGKYDNRVIIITADHESHPDFLNTPASELDDCRIPLYIINAGNVAQRLCNDDISQADVYPTLLDLFRLESPFPGVGNSLFATGARHNIKDNDARRISELIIRGNWFGR